VRLDRVLAGFFYGGKGRGPIGMPVRILSGVVGLFLMALGIGAFFAKDRDLILPGIVAGTLGLFFVMIGLKAGPAPPGSRSLQLVKHRRAQRAQAVCMVVGFGGLASVQAAGSFHASWLARWLHRRATSPPPSSAAFGLPGLSPVVLPTITSLKHRTPGDASVALHNMRVQRTRSSASRHRAPLTRHPLGGWGIRRT
jgi:hypothetical protein